MTDDYLSKVQHIQFDKDSENPLIIIGNKGQELIETNYWETVCNEKGLVMVTRNAGNLRLLLPDVFATAETLNDYKQADHAVLTTGSWLGNPLVYEIMLEDFSNSPHVFHLMPHVFLEGAPSLDSDTCRFSVWIKGPIKVCDMKCYIRKTTHRLPHMKPIKEH